MTREKGKRQWADTISPELEIVQCCARWQIDPESQNRVCDLASKGLNWHEVVANANQHRMSPVLYESITAVGQGRIPLGSHQQILRDAFRDSATNALGLVGELLLLHQRFQAAEIPVIPFKGPVLATLAYGNFAKRDYADLDFGLEQRYIPQAIEVLRDAGYRPTFDPKEVHDGKRAFAPGQYSFEACGRTIQVELHTERTLRYFPAPLDFPHLISRLIPVEIAGRSLRTFSVEDTVVMLCVHGAKHFWDRLIWVFDIAKLITVQEVDWTLLQQIAAEMKSTRVALLGLYLAHDLFGARLPESVLQAACGDRGVRKLAQKVCEQYAGISDPSAGVWSRAAFRLRSRDGMGQALRHMMRLVLSPTESDRQTVHLPRFLTPLYTFVRPWRLLREYGLASRRRRKPDLAVFDPTPAELVDNMLRFAGISPGDVLYDLGCGDGRVVVAAVEKYGIRAVGVDNDPERIAEAQANARRHGVTDRTRFLLEDARQVDLSEATIITLYLEKEGVMRLAERLRTLSRPGVRIISRAFKIYGWTPDRVERHTLPSGLQEHLYLWMIKTGEEEHPAAKSASPELYAPHNAEG